MEAIVIMIIDPNEIYAQGDAKLRVHPIEETSFGTIKRGSRGL